MDDDELLNYLVMILSFVTASCMGLYAMWTLSLLLKFQTGSCRRMAIGFLQISFIMLNMVIESNCLDIKKWEGKSVDRDQHSGQDLHCLPSSWQVVLTCC